jgi:GDP-L-fucose synthase
MKILLTGGSGFIGRNLFEYLQPKYQVFAPTHKELELLDESAVRKYLDNRKFDIVIHSAVRPGHRNAKDPSGQLDSNLRMFFNIVRNKDKFDKLIFLSSGAVYDVTKPIIKVKENYFDSFVPQDEHGFSKYIIGKYIEKINNVVELRIFGIFGKYEDYSIRFISNAICKNIFNLPITLKQDRKFDYLYINDLMIVVDYFIENVGKYKAYNITPDVSVDLFDLAKKVKKISGKDLPIKVGQKGIGFEYSGNNRRIYQEIKGLNFTPIDMAISELYKWYLKNKYLINKDLLLFDK